MGKGKRRWYSWLGFLKAFPLCLAVASGSLGVLRDGMFLLTGTQPSDAHALFWAYLRVCFIAASATAWALEHKKVRALESRLDEITSHADIQGEITNASFTENPLGTVDRLPHFRIWISATIVNKSPIVSPLIDNFVCELLMEDGEQLSISYEKDFTHDHNSSHRDEYGRPTGPFPTLAWHNHQPFVKDQARTGGVRFELSGTFDRVEWRKGCLTLVVIEGGTNRHEIGKLKWPYVRRKVSQLI